MRALAIAALAIATPLSAQEVQQTPEGAQQFLALIAEQQKPLIGMPEVVLASAGFGISYRATFRATGPCATEITGELATYSYYDRANLQWIRVDPGSSRYNARALPKWVEQSGSRKLPMVLAWDRVSGIGLGATMFGDDAAKPVVLFKYEGKDWGLEWQDTVTAKRVEYAMKFLQASCDKTAETGF